MRNQRSKNGDRGFTLIEMIVSLAIFMIVAVVAVGSLVRVVALNRQAQTLQSSVNNVSFALDSMSREIRQGSGLVCISGYNGFTPFLPTDTVGSPCSGISNLNQVIVFQTADVDSSGCPLASAYYFGGSAGAYTLQKAQQTSCTDQFGSPQAPFTPVISPDVKITDYRLAMFSDSTFQYKWIFVRLSGNSGVREQDKNYFDVETSISQRIHD